jgi:branched-chain amino acid transport system permease protein
MEHFIPPNRGGVVFYHPGWLIKRYWKKRIEMDEVVTTIINILIVSSMYILVALGFAFLFNMLGILNLAHGSIYMIGGYICYSLVVGLGFNQWAGLVVTTLVLAAFGIFLEKYCFRPFVGDFNRIVMICVAITIVLQTIVNNMVGSKIMAIPAFVEGVLRTGLFSVNYERISTFAMGASFLVIIVWVVNRTRWGQQMQAIAQNMEGAFLQGINVHRISSLSCALGCGLAALAGCLMGAFTRLGPFMGDTMLVKVLVIVMLAGVGSLGGIFIGGLILGSLDAVLPVVLGGAVSDAVSITIVIVILLFRPKGFFGHEAEIISDSKSSETMLSGIITGGGKWAKPTIWATFTIILALLPLLIDSSYTLHILILCFIYTIGSVSLRTITISGQFPLAHGAFMGIGAYLSGMLAKWFQLSPWITIPIGALLTMGVGIVTGYPFARLRTFYYAMGSMFFGVGVALIINAGGIWTGSYGGLRGIPPLFTGSYVSYYYFFLGLGLVSIIALYRFEFSRIGTNLKAVAQSHLIASSVGINESFYRILVVAVGCFFAGLSGASYAHYSMVISTTSFNLGATLWLVMYVLIGGIGNFTGPIVGTFVLFLIPEYFRDLKMYSPYISAIILLVVVYLMPQGLTSLPQMVRWWYQERRKGGRVSYVSGV